MSEYVILTDSACDLPAPMVEALELAVVPLCFTIDGQTYHDYPDKREMSPAELIARQKQGQMATTNAINVAEATEAILPFVQQGKDVLVMSFSSGLSATCNSYRIAASELNERFPECRVEVVDTLCASLGQGMLVYQAAKLRQSGKSLDEVRDWTERNKLRQCHWFTVNDLFFLKKGGRVSAATAVLGTMLQIKPVLHVDDDGHLINVGKARGRKASLESMVKMAQELGEDLPAQTVFVSHTDSPDDAQWVADEMKKRYGVKEVIINDIGPVICAHTGPGCVALFFMGKHR